MNSSKIFRLNLRDIALGFFLSVLTAALIYLQAALQAPNFSWNAINWLVLSQLSASAGIAYLLKNFLSDNEGRLLGSM
jgi:hypothetical protein